MKRRRLSEVSNELTLERLWIIRNNEKVSHNVLFRELNTSDLESLYDTSNLSKLGSGGCGMCGSV